MVPTYSKCPRNVPYDYYSFVIGEMWVITENQPPTNSVQNRQNVLGVYHMTGSVVGPGDMEVILEVTDVYRANDSGTWEVQGEVGSQVIMAGQRRT